MVSGMTEHGELKAVRHPSGWWKASDGEWYPPEDDRHVTPADSSDLFTAVNLAIAAVVIGSLLPWTHVLFDSVRGTDGNGLGNLTLLLGGTASALLVKWRLDGGASRRLLTTSLVLCAAASAIVLYELPRMTGALQSGVFLTAAGAVAATGLTAVLRQRARFVPA